MIVRQRQMMASFVLKSRNNKKFIQEMGIEITYSDDDITKGENNYEKDSNRKRDERS